MLEVWETTLSSVYIKVSKHLNDDWENYLYLGIAESVRLLITLNDTHASFAITHYRTLGDCASTHLRIIKPASWTSRIVEYILDGVKEYLIVDKSEHNQCFYKLYDDSPHFIVGDRTNSYVLSRHMSFALAEHYIIKPILKNNPEDISVFNYRDNIIHVASGVLVLSSTKNEVYLTYDDSDSMSAYETWCNCQKRRSISWHIH